jgi:hypothetical protein
MENKPLKSLKKTERPEEEERGLSEEVVVALGTEPAEGRKELYCFLGRRGVCSTSFTKVLLDTVSINAMMYGA